MKKYLIKSGIFGLIVFGIMCFNYPLAYYYDTFNVFHWENIRFTSAEPNKNFVKTKYILANPQKFNAFIFGSSRVGNIPQTMLPGELNGEPLHWYNMTYSVGIPRENFLTLKTFLQNSVGVKVVMMGFDELALYNSYEDHTKELLRFPYQEYEKGKLHFFRPYLETFVDSSIKKEIRQYKDSEYTAAADEFYGWGGNADDFSLTENPDLSRYEESFTVPPAYTDSYKDIEDMVDLCGRHGITLILFTNPTFQTMFYETLKWGESFFDWLRNVAKKCEFYNFFAFNNYTTDPHYYFESSHYRPVVGLMVEQLIFGTEEEKARIRREAGDELWGMKVNAENVEQVIHHLKVQKKTKYAAD